MYLNDAICDPSVFPQGERGVTTWELGSNLTLAAYDNVTLDFTCSRPQCWRAKDSCNVTFCATANTSGEVSLDYYLDTHYVGGSKFSGGGGWQSFDLAAGNAGVYYNDGGYNNFTIRNNTAATTVTISNFRILRIYQMDNLEVDGYKMCNGDASITPTGWLDNNATKVDKPCNFESCGGWSHSYGIDCQHLNDTIAAHQSFNWTVDWSDFSRGNYEGGLKCLFNFNQMWANNTTSNDVELKAYIKSDGVNEYYLASYYLSKLGSGYGMFPSYDLALSPHYNDAGSNTIRLENNSDVPVFMAECVNVYRVYQTGSACPCEIACQVNCQVFEDQPGGCCQFCQGCVIPCYTCYVSGCEVPCEICEGCNTVEETECHVGCEVCCTTGQTYYWLTVNAYDTYDNDSLSPNVTVDEIYLGTAPVSTQVNSGYHSITVDTLTPDTTSGPYYLTGFSDSYGNGESREITGDIEITAIYDLGGRK